MNRIDSAMNQLRPAKVSTASSTTPLDFILNGLQKFNTPPTSTAGYRAKRRARIQAVRWLNRLDTTDRLDELWPAFEDWLVCPENRYQYWAAERTRRALDELGRWCPPEGSAEAEQLLRLSTVPPWHWRSHIAPLAKCVLVSTGFVASIVAMYLAFR
jgi:ferric-dicitrate binding protein FerR (iron transport regulator)